MLCVLALAVPARLLTRAPLAFRGAASSIRCAATRASYERETERGVEFVGSYQTCASMPATRLPEVAFFGRSNVGKSSALNCLAGRSRTKVARVSKTPGCTAALNLYQVGNACNICDLPGYGFAQRGQALQEQWGQTISEYVADREQLRVLVVFVDPRHGPKENDANFFDWLDGFNIKDAGLVTVATKVDTLKPAEINDRLLEMQQAYGLAAAPIAFSATKGTGRSELWREIERVARSE